MFNFIKVFSNRKKYDRQLDLIMDLFNLYFYRLGKDIREKMNSIIDDEKRNVRVAQLEQCDRANLQSADLLNSLFRHIRLFGSYKLKEAIVLENQQIETFKSRSSNLIENILSSYRDILVQIYLYERATESINSEISDIFSDIGELLSLSVHTIESVKSFESSN